MAHGEILKRNLLRLKKAAYLLLGLPKWLRLKQRFPGALSIRTDIRMEEKLLLYSLARNTPESGVIVEIGSYLGASTSLLAIGASERGGHVYAVDTWRNEGMQEGPRDTYEEFMANTSDFATKITPLRGRSEDVVSKFSRKIDLLFIDGDHSYAGCEKDLVRWLPLMKEGGTVVVHDIGWAEGIQRAVADYLVPVAPRGVRRFPNIGWAVVERGSSGEPH